MQGDTIFRNSSILHCQKIPQGIRVRLENHVFPNWNQQKPILQNRKRELFKKRKKNFSCKSHSTKKPRRGFLGIFNIHSVANIKKLSLWMPKKITKKESQC